MIIMNILMLIVGIAFEILSIGYLFKKINIGPKSNPKHYSAIQLGSSYLMPILIGIVIIVFALN